MKQQLEQITNKHTQSGLSTFTFFRNFNISTKHFFYYYYYLLYFLVSIHIYLALLFNK